MEHDRSKPSPDLPLTVTFPHRQGPFSFQEFTMKIILSEPTVGMWGSEIPESTLSKVRTLSLAKLRDAYPEIRGLDTEWGTGPQANEVLVLTVDHLPMSVDATTLNLIATTVAFALQEAVDGLLRSRQGYYSPPSPEPWRRPV